MPNELNRFLSDSSQPLILNHEFKYALDQMEHSDKHIFISGKAGTGKSTLLQLFKDISKERVAIVAPTGVAALNVRGQTIHSFFRFPPRLLMGSDIHKLRNRSLYKNMDILVIDEISMVRADMLDNIDQFLRINRENPHPFGGVRVIYFGDLYQLPPVISNPDERAYLRSRYDSPYFFSSHVFNKEKDQTETIELHTVFRQSEKYFRDILERIRNNSYDQEDLEELNSRIRTPEEMLPGSVTLSTRNNIVDRINQRELAELDKPSHQFIASVNGRFDPRVYPTEMVLSLKVGAQVMTLRNDAQRRYVNGSVGIITKLTPDTVIIRLIDDSAGEEEIELEKHSWEMISYRFEKHSKRIETEVIGTFEQYPLRLAWAITIHKSQGKSFDKVYLDMGGGAFEFGQTYVALSRCRTLEGLQLKQALSPRDILVDEEIKDFYRHWE